MDDERRDRGFDLRAFLEWEEAAPPDSLRAAVETVIRDFWPNEISTRYGKRRDGGLVVTFDGSTWFLGAVPRGAELLVAVAHFLQDQAFDGQGSEPWGKAWPECPDHPHPPDPRVVDDEAVWVCPRDGRILAAVGHLTGN
jgi:hypothetical protein